ncbi:MAG: tripartite tricarboxylate transporter TctB family protein [Desulfarculaceae bacterium]|jgi:hypothetical protein
MAPPAPSLLEDIGMLAKNPDFKLSVGLFTFCIFLLVYLIPTQVGPLTEADALMPVLITGLIMILSISLMIQAARDKSAKTKVSVQEKKENKASRFSLVMVIAIMAVYAWLLEFTGFLLTSIIAMIVLFLVFGVKNLPKIVIIIIATLGCLYLCFETFLGAPLPMGTIIENLIE